LARSWQRGSWEVRARARAKNDRTVRTKMGGRVPDEYVAKGVGLLLDWSQDVLRRRHESSLDDRYKECRNGQRLDGRANAAWCLPPGVLFLFSCGRFISTFPKKTKRMRRVLSLAWQTRSQDQNAHRAFLFSSFFFHSDGSLVALVQSCFFQTSRRLHARSTVQFAEHQQCLVRSVIRPAIAVSGAIVLFSFSLSLSLSLSRFLYFFSFSLSLFLSFSLSLCLHFLFDVAIRHPFVGLHPKQMLFSKVCLCLKISFRNTRPKNIVLEHASERDVVLKKNVSETNVSETNVVFGFLILYSPTLRFSMLNRTPVRARIPPMFDFFFALFLSHSFSLSHTRTLFDSIHYESNRETSLSCSI